MADKHEEELQILSNALLKAIATGEVDAKAAARRLMANRGFDYRTGEWVGFNEASRIAEEGAEA